METSAINSNCAWCGSLHPQTVCPRVKAIEYYQDGTMKRVEFKTATDFAPTLSLGGQHVLGGAAPLPDISTTQVYDPCLRPHSRP